MRICIHLSIAIITWILVLWSTLIRTLEELILERKKYTSTTKDLSNRYYVIGSREIFEYDFFFFFEQKQAENRYYENIIKSRKKKSRNNEPPTGFCCNDFSYLTDRGGEADDENSQHMERPIRKHYLDEKPQKENTLLESSDESILDYCEGLDMEPILKSMFKNYKLEILPQNLRYNKILFFSRISFLFK